MDRISARDYRDLVTVADPQLSPDGERVAFVRTVPTGDREYESTIHVVSTDGDPRRFTAREGTDAEPRWSPGGDRLAFVSERGEDDAPQVWVMPADGGEAERITNAVGGVADVAWSPDGERIAFTQRATADERERGLDLDANAEEGYERAPPDPRVIDRTVYRAGTAYFDGLREHVYTVSLDDGAVTRHTEGDADFVAPAFDPDDPDTLYYAVNRQPDPDDSIRYDVDALDLATGDAETVTRTTGWVTDLAVSGGRIAYPRTPEERASMRGTDVEVFDRATGEAVTVTSALDRTVEPTSIRWDGEGERLYFLTPDEGRVVLRRAAPEEGADPEVVVGEGELVGASARAGRVAFVRSDWDHPGDVFSLDAGEAARRLTTVNADYLAAHRVGEPEEVRFESEDGVEVQGWVLVPPDFDPSRRYPLIVEIHGGPHATWTTSGTMWHEFQTLAARGYVVFWCNPRGSTGYGEAFATAIERNWGEVTARDVLAGADAVCERAYVDESNQFVTGGSFGGFLTAWLVGHTDRFRAAVAQRGVYDLASFYGSTDAFKLVEWEFDTVPWEDAAFLRAQSPAAHVGDVTTPTLLLHADDDYRVPVNDAELLYRALRKNGFDTRLVRYPREGHELSRSGEPAHVVDRLERIARWFDGYSDYRDVPPALERGDDGLSTAGVERGDEGEDGTDGE
ncbi:S9 family peptidase [Halomarina pelagica]|uniref:S9 family peptidase n=1 Tax=Halomarina pelagica TaxID=2961599 RepID=UPI0020C40D7E|nr:S9 family peptidase [Halomarina sp. BND7]